MQPCLRLLIICTYFLIRSCPTLTPLRLLTEIPASTAAVLSCLELQKSYRELMGQFEERMLDERRS